ncbi:MAG: hypothetical protein Q4G43_17555, partial [Mobilicoccus sp.]|nr:hypothetical protein [Mobilicoccus sp.]
MLSTTLVRRLCVGVAATALTLTPMSLPTAQAAPTCGITWGSLTKSAGTLTGQTLTNVRTGRHACFDRLVVDLSG